jgi:hypothetical protein
MAKAKTHPTPDTSSITVGTGELAAAIAAATTSAIEISRPQKKNPFNRKKNTPWTPQDGSQKLKLKRKFYQHGIEIREKMHSNEEIALMNLVRPGVYCNGYVKVNRRRDKGIDIEYPVKTASQRLKLINEFGVRSISELLQRCIDEANTPKRDEFADVDN